MIGFLKESYKPPEERRKELDGFRLMEFQSPTIAAYIRDRKIIIAIRGTKFEGMDLSADIQTIIGSIPKTIRFKNDKRFIRMVKKHYPPRRYFYQYYAHSLGGAILDEIIEGDSGAFEATSYNPAVSTKFLRKKNRNVRIYHSNDPLLELYSKIGFDDYIVDDETESMSRDALHHIPFIGKAIELYHRLIGHKL